VFLARIVPRLLALIAVADVPEEAAPAEAVLKEEVAETPATTVDEAEAPTATEATPTSPIQASLCFVFGLISADPSSMVDGYLQTTDQIVESTIGKEKKAEMIFEYPVVKAIAADRECFDVSCLCHCISFVSNQTALSKLRGSIR